MVISWFWRFNCAPNSKGICYEGGYVGSAVAYSHNSMNWTAVGQFPLTPSPSPPPPPSPLPLPPPLASPSQPSPSPSPSPVVPRNPTANTDLGHGSLAYNHTYTVYKNKTLGALACQKECDNDGGCAAWTYVIYNDGTPGPERCCTTLNLNPNPYTLSPNHKTQAAICLPLVHTTPTFLQFYADVRSCTQNQTNAGVHFQAGSTWSIVQYTTKGAFPVPR